MISVQSHAKKIDGIAAVVNDKAVTISELEKALETNKRFSGGAAEPSKEAALELLIENVLMEEEVQALKIEVSDEEINAAVADVRQRNQLSEEQFRVFILSKGIEFDEYLDEIKSQIKKAKLANRVLRARLRVGDEALKNYYLKNVADYSEPEKIKLSHILFSEDAMPETIKEVQSKISAGENFSDLARKFSNGPTADKGGDMGYVTVEDLSSEIKSAIDGLQNQAITNPIEIGRRIHIFKVEDHLPGKTLTFEEARDKIQDKYFKDVEEELYRGWLESLKANARIERRL